MKFLQLLSIFAVALVGLASAQENNLRFENTITRGAAVEEQGHRLLSKSKGKGSGSKSSKSMAKGKGKGSKSSDSAAPSESPSAEPSSSKGKGKGSKGSKSSKSMSKGKGKGKSNVYIFQSVENMISSPVSQPIYCPFLKI